MEEKLGLFLGGEDKPSLEDCRKIHENGEEYKYNMSLYDEVNVNRNFYIGKQWVGVEANGLPQPVFNFLGRVTGFVCSSITSDNIAVQTTQLRGSSKEKPQTKNKELAPTPDVLNSEFGTFVEQTSLPMHLKQLAFRGAVDGSCGWYVWWDKKRHVVDLEEIHTEYITFGDPTIADEQKQPYIQIERRLSLVDAKRRAREFGEPTEKIVCNYRRNNATDDNKIDYNREYVNVYLTLWRDPDSDEIWACESTEDAWVRQPWSLGIKLYPIVWFTWSDIPDSYLGQSMIGGLLPNQIFVNKMYAMVMVSMMRSAFPKTLYNSTVIKRWDNRVGGAIPVAGGDMNMVAKVIDPPSISPQVSQFLELVMQKTTEQMGATSASLGEQRSDNTSALIANQKAAQTPHEITKQHLNNCLERLCRIVLEFWAEYYGKRWVMVPPTEMMEEMAQFAETTLESDELPVQYDFKELKKHEYTVKIDVGASTYFSQVQAQSAMDNLAQMGLIDLIDYLEHIPDGTIPGQKDIIKKKKKEKEQQMQMQQQMQQFVQSGGPQGGKPGGQENTSPNTAGEKNPEANIRGGKGYNRLARAINKTGLDNTHI